MLYEKFLFHTYFLDLFGKTMYHLKIYFLHNIKLFEKWKMQ